MMSRVVGFVLVANMMISFRLRGRIARGIAHGLDIELDVHSIAHEHAARFEQLVPLEPEVLAIDRRLRNESDALVPPRVHAAAGGLDVQCDLARGIANRELTDHAQTIRADISDA